MKVLVLGCTETTISVLRAVIDAGCEPVALCTLPETFEISYSQTPVRIVRYIPLAEAEKTGVKIIIAPRDTGKIMDEISPLRPDLILVAGWYYIVPARIRELAPLGCLGLHASLLPRNAGGAPLNWAIINGEDETGVTLFHLEDEMDTGDIVAQRRIPIEIADTIATLYDRVDRACYEILLDILPKIEAGSAPRIRQDLSRRTVLPQRSPKDGWIDWSRPAEEIYNFVRALTRPYPGAFAHIEGRTVRVWAVRNTGRRAEGFPPGSVISRDDPAGPLVATGDGEALITDYEICENF